MKFKTMVLTSIILAITSININALEIKDAYDEILILHKDDDLNYRRDLKQYLNDNWMLSSSEFEKMLSIKKQSNNTKIERWWLIESGNLIFDDLIFNDSIIKANYLKELTLNNGNEKASYTKIKKELISIIEKVPKIYEDNLSKVDIDDLFLKYFGRKANKQEEKWMEKIETVKYALYSGELCNEDETLTENEIKLIDMNKGYTLFNMNNVEYERFMQYVELHNKIEIIETRYIRTVHKLKNIKTLIKDTYKIDINSVFTENELIDDVYLKSINNYQFDESKALNILIDKLEELNLIDTSIIKPPTIKPPTIKPPNTEDTDKDNTPKPPIKDDFSNNSDTTKDKLINSEIFKVLNSTASNLYKVKSQILQGKYVFFKNNGKEHNTSILVDKYNNIKNNDTKTLLNILIKEFNLKKVSSKNKMMLLNAPNLVITESKKNDESSIFKFDNFKTFIKKLNIDIYLKNNNQ